MLTQLFLRLYTRTREEWVTKTGSLEETAQRGCVVTQHKGKNQEDKHLSGSNVRTFAPALGWGMRLMHTKNPFENHNAAILESTNEELRYTNVINSSQCNLLENNSYTNKLSFIL